MTRSARILTAALLGALGLVPAASAQVMAPVRMTPGVRQAQALAAPAAPGAAAAPAPVVSSVAGPGLLPGAPVSSVTAAPTVVAAPTQVAGAPVVLETQDQAWSECFVGAGGASRRLFESDHAFDNFISPISNAVLSKDPRSLTEVCALYIYDDIPNDNQALGGGNFHVAAAQVRVALTDRLTLIADKDGYAWINPTNVPGGVDGWLSIALGLKYLFVRDVENQFLWSGGFQFEVPTGEADVFQADGNGIMTVFTTVGKQIGDCNHFVGTFGYQFPMNSTYQSNFLYTSLHLDRQIGKFYPLFEANWFQYLGGGNHGIPSIVGEGDGLINIGTSGVAGNCLVFLGPGLAYKPGPHMEIGAVWEFPVTGRRDLLDNRLTSHLILRY